MLNKKIVCFGDVKKTFNISRKDMEWMVKKIPEVDQWSMYEGDKSQSEFWDTR